MSRILDGISTLILFGVLLASTNGCSDKTSNDSDSPDTSNVESTTDRQDGAQLPDKTPDKATTAEPATFEYVRPDLTEEELRQGWISLFDGATLFGWDVLAESNWHVEDACIVADKGERSLLLTPFEFDDFEFRCDFHLEKGGNSGVFLRTAANASNPATDTYELNICDSHDTHKTGSLVGRHVAENVQAVEGDWHSFHVSCNGTVIKVLLDGNPIVDFHDVTDSRRLTGQIGLQMNQGRIAFRNVFIRPLNTTSLFNETDLSGFRVVPGSQSDFSVRNSSIHAEGGPGFLETEATFKDFILHVESNINDEKAIAEGRPANSGVFFRAIAGTEDAPSHGYEMQIQHDFKDADRSQPLDFGSGAIYRRQAARYVVANNNEWVVQTLIAQKDSFATFVNGYQVLYWTDDRQPDPNPRKGLRLDAGHISLQGHDPTTNLDFRSIRIHEFTAE